MDNYRIKYPRTFHFPWSNASSDDKISTNWKNLMGQEVVITEKIDGENTTMYRDGIHSRSLDSGRHESRSYVYAKQASIGYRIPLGWRICGENCYARHSIHYRQLPDYFLAFSVWNEHNMCLSWDETVDFLNDIGIVSVPVLYIGILKEDIHQILNIDEDATEGYVVRTKGEFHYDEFAENVVKYVRPNHVQTDRHWMRQKIVPNTLHLH
jgi:hypothetical protein